MDIIGGSYDVSAEAHDSPLAQEALQRIGALYAIEAEIRGQSPQPRQTERQARAGPLLEALHHWLQETLRQVSRKSALAGVIGYTLKLWPALTRYRDDGRIEIDNNAAERALRAVALGRKNYLFAGSDDGGERAAAIGCFCLIMLCAPTALTRLESSLEEIPTSCNRAGNLLSDIL